MEIEINNIKHTLTDSQLEAAAKEWEKRKEDMPKIGDWVIMESDYHIRFGRVWAIDSDGEYRVGESGIVNNMGYYDGRQGKKCRKATQEEIQLLSKLLPKA